MKNTFTLRHTNRTQHYYSNANSCMFRLYETAIIHIKRKSYFVIYLKREVRLWLSRTAETWNYGRFVLLFRYCTSITGRNEQLDGFWWPARAALLSHLWRQCRNVNHFSLCFISTHCIKWTNVARSRMFEFLRNLAFGVRGVGLEETSWWFTQTNTHTHAPPPHTHTHIQLRANLQNSNYMGM